jgi:hypothetical protein
MINTVNGSPAGGYLSLVNGAIGPTAIPLQNLAFVGTSNTVTLQAASGNIAAERFYVTGITISSDDPAMALVTIDSGGSSPTKLASVYVSSTLPPVSLVFSPGIVRCAPAANPRATASAVATTKSIECRATGYISRI